MRIETTDHTEVLFLASQALAIINNLDQYLNFLGGHGDEKGFNQVYRKLKNLRDVAEACMVKHY